jgi:membrane-bound metal-dependent hydrolase YbcI (DUF457 family)
MSDTAKETSASSKSTFFDWAARWGFALSLFSFVLTFLILRFIGQDIRIMGGAIFLCATQIISFIFGVVSLFGHRKHKSSFWMALFAFLISGFFGFYIFYMLIWGIRDVQF